MGSLESNLKGFSLKWPVAGLLGISDQGRGQKHFAPSPIDSDELLNSRCVVGSLDKTFYEKYLL